MGMPSVETLTAFRMPSLQSCPHASFKAEHPRVHGICGRGASGFWNSFEQWSCNTRQCEKLAIHICSSTSSKGVSVGQSPREKLRRTVVVRGVPEKASDYCDTTNFFLDELMEAKSTVEKLAEREKLLDSSYPWQDEGTSQPTEDEETDSNGDNLKSSGLGKLPLESNGPPMVILQAYLKADTSQQLANSQQQEKEKLPQLPLPTPHKGRPAGLPRPSLRRRLGIAYSRKSVPAAGQESDSLAEI